MSGDRSHSVGRSPAWGPSEAGIDRRNERGPFDIIGDVHGCMDELKALLQQLGYKLDETASSGAHPDGRLAVFVGDLVDRGPATPEVLRLVMGMVREGSALCVPGNHEAKLVGALQGREPRPSRGLQLSLEQMAVAPSGFADEVVRFVDSLPRHLILDGGRLVVAHAGLPERFHGSDSARAEAFAMYGEKIPGTASAPPRRYAWAVDYRGTAAVVYGHTPVSTPEWVNNTICIDTGCVYGGSLTALRYPEQELVAQPAPGPYYTGRNAS